MPPTLYFEQTPASRQILRRMDEAANPGYNGVGGHANHSGEVGYWEALRRELEFRRVHVLPAEAERQRQREQIAFDKRAAAGKLKPGEIIGPPNPREGRGRLR